MDISNGCASPMDDEMWNEAEVYRRLMTLTVNPRSGVHECLRTTPLMTLAVKDAVNGESKDAYHDIRLRFARRIFNQYAVLGFHAGEHPGISKNEPILMNVNAPNSAFICGSQGSGKSYTLSCMLENCLIADRRIGQVNTPVAGVAFHYDPDSAASAAEAAHLCSMGIRVNVLVSQSNEHALRAVYSKLPDAESHLTVAPLLLRSSDLSVERMHRLMAFADKKSSMPLYMSVALRVLRQMAIEARGDGFDYKAFKRALESEKLTKEQFGPLNMRLELLESFLDLTKSKGKRSSKSLFHLEPGTLTIIDLTDPFMDPATVCILFDICLSLFKEHRPLCGLVVALDEAHKYMTSSLAASNFTERLLGTVREQRHNATRVIIATQEPTVSETLLDLCTVSIIHRFTSPAWFASIRNHLGAASKLVFSASEQDTMFNQIMDLNVGESLVFAPSAFLCLAETGAVSKLGSVAINMNTRTRIGSDGGTSVLTSTQNDSRLKEQGYHEQSAFTSEDHTSTPIEAERSNDAFDTYTAQTRQGRVATGLDHRRLSIEEDFHLLSGSRSHLVLICCSCENIVLVEFGGYFMPDLTEIDQENLRAGVAYATCVECQLHKVLETKNASKQFDHTRGKEFRNGTIAINDNLRNHLTIGLRPILGHDVTVLLRDGHLLYLFLRVVQRAIKGGDLLWTVQIGRDANIHPRVTLSSHQDGVFFKLSLQPKKNIS